MINTIIWDFDGVIVNSEKIRVNGFRYALRSFSEEQVEKFIKYHIANGELSDTKKLTISLLIFYLNPHSTT